MKAKIPARPFSRVAFGAAIALLCAYPVLEAANSDQGRPAAADETVKADIDFTRMNPTVKMAYIYRLGANPKAFAGKTVKISGMFLTRVDEEDGMRYFGCFMGDSEGCSCCSPGGVLEFMPKASYVWPADFPPLESRITVVGRIEIFEIGESAMRQSVYTIPRLVDACFL